ncbi:MAG: recombination mediator RecR [Patescibacteria group bacterium]|nr:recombination mediator RecR [Patescibacteria group bacterium]
MRFPRSIKKAIDAFSMLPSVGPKTAERYAFYLLNERPEKTEELVQALSHLRSGVTICHQCLALDEKDPCLLCADTQREQTLLCIVENTQDREVIEATGQYHGRYFVLGGLIDTISKVQPSDLNIRALIKSLKEKPVKEIILGLNFTLEGETTALYLKKILENYPAKITRLARGLPAGSDLEYADEMTLKNALNYRNEIK